MPRMNIRAIKFSKVYPMYVQKAERKGRTKAEVDEATGYFAQYWGFDVSADGNTFILGGAPGLTWELTVAADESVELGIARDGNNIVLSWPLAANEAVVEFSPTLSPIQFSGLDPHPAIVPAGNQNTVTVPMSGTTGFYRLRKD